MTKTCKTCGEEKLIGDFTPTANNCRPCRAEAARHYRRIHAAEIQNTNKGYARTKPGVIMRCYRNILGRVSGRMDRGRYIGLPVMPRREFYSWAIKNQDLDDLMDMYRESGYNLDYAPALAMINRRKGYISGNIRFVPTSENRYGPREKWHKT